MIGLSSLVDRLQTLEQTIQRSNAQLQLQPLPPLELGQTSAAISSAATPAPSHSTILSKLSELVLAFQSVTQQDGQLQAYLAALPDLQTIIQTHAQSTAGGNSTATTPAQAALITREEEVVLSGADMFERTSGMLAQIQSLQGIIDQKWPIEDVATLTRRVQTLQAALPQRAFQAAQQHVQFEQFLHAYTELIDLCNRQFVLWNSELDKMEREVDQTLAQQQRKI